MGVPRVAVPIGQDAEALGPADPVLDRDPEAAEAAVAVLLLGGQFAPPGPLVGDADVRVFLGVALVGAVGVAARVRRQRRPRAADRQITLAAGTRVRHADDAAVAGGDVLGLQGMALLLARVVRPLGGLVLRPLDRLLGAVDDQRLGFLRADARLAAEGEEGPHLRLDAADRLGERRVG